MIHQLVGVLVAFLPTIAVLFIVLSAADFEDDTEKFEMWLLVILISMVIVMLAFLFIIGIRCAVWGFW